MSAPTELVLLDALRTSPVAFGLFDPGERLREANAPFYDIFDVPPDEPHTWESLMRGCHRRRRGLLIDSPDIDAWIAGVRQRFRRSPVRRFESDLCDGRWMFVTETTRPDGWVLTQLIDVTVLKANEATLRRARDEALLASMTDALTHLHNRRAVFERLSDLLATTRRMKMPFAVAVIDLDHFKSINDRHGHGVGDDVLQHFAAMLRQGIRPLDVAGRLGGEEFVLLLPNVPLDGAARIVERLRQQVRGSQALPQRLPELRYSFSAGLTDARPDDTPDQVIHRADAALYDAKRQGRDRVVVRADTDG